MIGKPDAEAGEIPKALVILRPGEEVAPEALMEFVESRVAGYKKIREVEFVTSIPKTASGKVLRRVLIEAERLQGERSRRRGVVMPLALRLGNEGGAG